MRVELFSFGQFWKYRQYVQSTTSRSRRPPCDLCNLLNPIYFDFSENTLWLLCHTHCIFRRQLELGSHLQLASLDKNGNHKQVLSSLAIQETSSHYATTKESKTKCLPKTSHSLRSSVGEISLLFPKTQESSRFQGIHDSIPPLSPSLFSPCSCVSTKGKQKKVLPTHDSPPSIPKGIVQSKIPPPPPPSPPISRCLLFPVSTLFLGQTFAPFPPWPPVFSLPRQLTLQLATAKLSPPPQLKSVLPLRRVKTLWRKEDLGVENCFFSKRAGVVFFSRKIFQPMRALPPKKCPYVLVSNPTRLLFDRRRYGW